eukprot:scaffold284592_cov48-Prasinocladus_malaysianus.AAC.1
MTSSAFHLTAVTPVMPCHKPKVNVWHSQAKREEFWDTQPAYGGNKGDSLTTVAPQPESNQAMVWDTLKGALECDDATMKLMLEAAEIIVTKDDMSEIFDSR